MVKCYENNCCDFCHKKNCNQRKKEYTGKENNFICDGNCNECKRAIRYELFCQILDIKRIDFGLQSCVMYQLIKKGDYIFYGKEGENCNYSKVEKSILQFQKCYFCEKQREYYNTLEIIKDKSDLLVKYFCEMTDSAKQIDKLIISIDDMLKTKNNICKQKFKVESYVVQYIGAMEGKRINLNDMCDYIKKESYKFNFFIHPLTLKYIIMNMETKSY